MSDRHESLNMLYFPFRERLQIGLDAANKRGIICAPFETYRSPSRQKTLYDQGRINTLPKATNAQPLRSWHQYGLACDVVFKDKLGNWTWQGDYQTLAGMLKIHGVTWLGDSEKFPEKPHFEMTFGATLDKCQQLYIGGGIMAVWDYIDTLQRSFP